MSISKTPMETLTDHLLHVTSIKQVKKWVTQGRRKNGKDVFAKYDHGITQFSYLCGKDIHEDVLGGMLDVLNEAKNLPVSREENICSALRRAIIKMQVNNIRIIAKRRRADLELWDSDGHTALIAAVVHSTDSHAIVQELLDLGADPLGVNKEGASALLQAVVDNQIEAARVLVSHPLAAKFVNLAEHTGVTPLNSAIATGKRDMVKLLLDAGANVPAVIYSGSDRSPLFLAVINNQTEIVRLLVDNSSSPAAFVSLASTNGVTPLMVAISKGYRDIIEVLLDAGANVQTVNDRGISPLFLAANENQTEMVRLLISYSSSPAEFVNLTSANGDTTLLLAAREGFPDIVKVLLGAGSDPCIVDKEGRTALFCAAAQYQATEDNRMEVVRLLVGHPSAAEFVNLAGGSGFTPLALVTKSGSPGIVNVLLDAGADPRAVFKEGMTALHQAVASNNKKVVRALVSHPLAAEFVDLATADGDTPLHFAVFRGRPRMVKALLDAGANVLAVNTSGASALAIAVRCDNKEIVEMLADHHKSLDLFNLTTKGFTPLMIAASLGRRKMVKVLVQKHPDWLAVVSNGLTAFLIACSQGHARTAGLLLDKDTSQLEAKTTEGCTALILAAKGNHGSTVDLLVERGADKSAKDKTHGLTAAEWAEKMGHHSLKEEFFLYDHPMECVD